MSHIHLAPKDVPSYASALLELQHAAYAVEAALIQDDRIPALDETADDLVAAQLCWLIELDAEHIVGALGYDTNDGVTAIDRLIVDPSHHRRGIGRRLVMQILAGGGGVTVSTGRENGPARRLYQTAGFIHIADREVLPGLVVSDYAIASVTENPQPRGIHPRSRHGGLRSEPGCRSATNEGRDGPVARPSLSTESLGAQLVDEGLCVGCKNSATGPGIDRFGPPVP